METKITGTPDFIQNLLSDLHLHKKYNTTYYALAVFL